MTSNPKLFPAVLLLIIMGCLAIRMASTAAHPDTPSSGTGLMHQGHKDTLRIQTFATHFRNITSKSLSVNLCLTEFFPGDAAVETSAQDRGQASVSLRCGALNSPSPV